LRFCRRKWSRKVVDTQQEAEQLREGVIPEKKQEIEKPKPKPKQELAPPKLELAERPKQEMKGPTSEELYRDYIQASRHPDMTPQEQQRLRDMISERGRIERGEVPDVGLSAEEVSLEVDKYRPQAMEQRVAAAQAALKEGKGVVGSPEGKTKAQIDVERRKAREVQAMAQRKKRLGIREFLMGERDDILGEQLTPAKTKYRLRVLKLLHDFMVANNLYDMNDMTPDMAREWIRGFGRGGYAASTINGYVATARAIFQKAVDRKFLGRNPFSKDFVEKAKVLKKAPMIVDARTVRAVIKAIPADAMNRVRDIALIKLIFTAGIRAAETRGLTPADIQMKERTAIVFGKGAKERRVMFTKGARDAISEYVEKERSKIPNSEKVPYLFLSSRGNPLSNVAIRRIVQKHFARKGVKITTHHLRHSFAVSMLEGGMNIRVVQELLGHVELATTAKYLDMSLKHIKAQHAKLKQIPVFDETKDQMIIEPDGTILVVPKDEGGKLKPAMRKLTPNEKKLGLKSPVTKSLWGDLLGTPMVLLKYATAATKAFGEKASLRKGWISKAGDVFPVEMAHGNWDHTKQLNRHAVNWVKAFDEGLVRVASFDYGHSSSIEFSLSTKGLNASNLSVMKQYAADVALDGKTNVALVYNADGTIGRIEFYRSSQAARAVDQAVSMARGTLKPAINRDAYKKWKAHQMRSTENYRKAQETKQKALLKKKRALYRRIKKMEKESERAYKQGLRDAKKQLMQFVREGVGWRKKFADYVNQSLPANIRGKLNKVLAGITDKDSQLKAMGRLIKEIERLEQREALGRLKRWIARFGKDFGFHHKQGYKKGMKFKISTPFSKAIESLLDSIILATPRDRASLVELLEYAKQEKYAAEEQLREEGRSIEQATNPYIVFEIDKLIEELERKLNAKNVREWDAADIDDMLETLDIILGEWKHKRSEYAKAKAEEFEQDKGNALEDIGSGHKKIIPEDDSDAAFEKGWNRYRATGIAFWKGLFGRFNYNIQTLVRIMGGMKYGALYAVLVHDLQTGRDIEKSHVFQIMDEFQRMWKKAGFTEDELMSYSTYGNVRGKALPKNVEAWLAETMPEWAGKRGKYIPAELSTITLKSGKKLRVTVAEALSILMHTGNEFSYNALKKSGMVTRRNVLRRLKLQDDDFDAIRKAVPKKALKMIPILRKMMELQQDAINEVSDRMYGYNLANVDNYWHLRRFKLKGARGKKGEAVKQTIESRSHFKERRGGDDPIYIDDVFNELVDTVRVGAEFIGLAEPFEGIRKMTNDPDIQRALMERGYGEYFTDYVKQVDMIQEHHVGMDWWERLYGAWARNITRAVFGVNLRVSAQQYASVMLATSELGLESLKNVRGKFDPTLKKRMESWSPMVRERFMGAITRELGDVAKTGGVWRFMTGRDQLINLPTVLVKAFDMLAVMDVWRMSEGQVMSRAQYRDSGISQEQLIREADTLSYKERLALDKKRGTNVADYQLAVTQTAEETIRITQPTWDIIDRSRIGSVKSPMVKALTMFHSQREKMAQMIGIANSRYMNELEFIRRENKLTKLKDAALTQDGIKALRKAVRTYALVLLNTAAVKAWGSLYGAALLGRPGEPEEWATSFIADIPGMYYFGDVGRSVVTSWGKRLQGTKTYQLGSYEPPPLRVVSSSKIAAYEIGVLMMMTTGIERSNERKIRRQLTKTLDKTWEAVNYSGGLPFNHVTDVISNFGEGRGKGGK
jgi:site-specific recombinase XerD